MTHTLGRLLILSMLISTTSQARTMPNAGGDAPVMAKVKVGRTVTLVLTNGTRVKGRITAMSAESLEITPVKGVAQVVALSDIAAVRTGLPIWGKLLIGTGVAYGVLLILFLTTGGIGPVCC
jgi:hypothetical protein